jgi:Tfp pilus assembly protein FimT
MATITTTSGGASAGRTAGSVPYLVDRFIDFAAAATSKGSALAAADVIECISVPANTLILNAGIEITTLLAGESNDTTFDLGVTGVDADVFVDGFDADAAAAGAYAQNAAAFQPVVIATADTIDLLIATATTAPTSGVARVWAVLMNVDGRIAADEVDRDQLA